eukprot:4304167-Amphidinium_carterae.1
MGAFVTTGRLPLGATKIHSAKKAQQATSCRIVAVCRVLLLVPCLILSRLQEGQPSWLRSRALKSAIS